MGCTRSYHFAGEKKLTISRSTDQRPMAMHVHFWADIRNSSGSVEKVITALAAHGREYLHCIACCMPSDKASPPPNLEPFEHYGVKVFPFIESAWRNRLLNKVLGLGAFTYPNLITLLQRHRPSVVHFHNRQELVDPIVRRLSFRPAIAVHYHRHFDKPIVPENADLLVYPSSATERYIKENVADRKRGLVLLNPLSLEVLGQVEKPLSTVPQEVHKGPPVILYGGGSNPVKGLTELLQAYQQLPKGVACLVLAGRGVECMGIDLAGVEVLGEIPATEFLDRVAQADVVTMPSYSEAFGLVAQEAMLLGTLMVVTNAGGLVDFTGNDCAIVVKPRDVESLRSGLEKALALVRNNGTGPYLAKAHERVLQLSPEHIVPKLEQAYNSISLGFVQ